MRKYLYLKSKERNSKVSALLKQIRPQTTEHPLIRIGSERDGGYLIPDDLDGVKYCFSPGVSKVATFEESLGQLGVHSFMADYSVEAPPVQSKYFHFQKKFLGNKNDSVFMTLKDWVEKSVASVENDLILQMDIEGAEYEVLVETPPEILKRFRILVIEFHYLHEMTTFLGNSLTSSVFTKLLNDFEIVHIHPNNCSPPFKKGNLNISPVMEFSFLRKDRIKSKMPTRKFPNPLDVKNVKFNPDYALPECWYKFEEDN